MNGSNLAKLGIFLVLIYNILQSIKSVALGVLLQRFDSIVLLVASFTLVAIFFNTTQATQWREYFKAIQVSARDVIMLNITTAYAWTSFYICLFYLEPAIYASMVGCIVPGATILLAKLLRLETRIGKMEIVGALGSCLSLALLVYWTWAGLTSVGKLTTHDLVIGLTSAIVNSIAIVGNTLYSKQLSKGCDLRLMSSIKKASDVQRDGKNLVLVATVGQVLHFRIFDPGGKMVVDTDEQKLTAKAKQIEDLKARLIDLWPSHELSTNEKDQILDDVTSIVGYTRDKGWSPSRIMAVRWFLLLAIGILMLPGLLLPETIRGVGTSENIFFWKVVLANSLFLIASLFALQLGIKATDPILVALTLATWPAFVFATQPFALDPRLIFSNHTLIAMGLATACSILGVVGKFKQARQGAAPRPAHTFSLIEKIVRNRAKTHEAPSEPQVSDTSRGVSGDRERLRMTRKGRDYN